MAKQSKKKQNSQTNLGETAMVTFANDLEQAKDYEVLLKRNDIPVIIVESDKQTSEDKGIAVMVPEEYLDEAHVIIESQDAYDDFYDFALEEDNDFDSELLDDEL